MGTDERGRQKIDALKARKAQLEARIKVAERREASAKRKADTRLKVLIDAAIIADSAIHPEGIADIKAVLDRAILRDNDRIVLKGAGWL